MKQFLQQLYADDEGATAIEYALIAALIAVGLLVVLGDVGAAIQATFQRIADALGA
jgi:pilus assembly protein Flp/PilA